jgi:hypothetical protein
MKAGNTLAIHGEGGISQLIEFGVQLQDLSLYQSKIPSHIVPTFLVDQNFINAVIKKYQTIEGREFLKGHLKGHPQLGEIWYVDMEINGICAGPITDYTQHDNYYDLTPTVSWSEKEQQIRSLWAAVYFEKEVAYDYIIYAWWSFKKIGDWIAQKITGKKDVTPWLGQRTQIEGYRDSSQWQQDCIELEARLANWCAITYNQRPKLWKGNVNALQPWDILVNTDYTIESDGMQNPFNKPDYIALQNNFNARMNLIT